MGGFGAFRACFPENRPETGLAQTLAGPPDATRSWERPKLVSLAYLFTAEMAGLASVPPPENR